MKLYCLIIILVFITCNTSNCEESGQERQNKNETINNIRIQFREGVFDDNIDRERDIQLTYFALFPKGIFFFLNVEYIFDRSTYKFY